MFNVCSIYHKTMDTYFIKCIVVFGFLCTIGSAQYNVQPIPGEVKNTKSMITETVVVPKLNTNDKVIPNKSFSLNVTVPPLIFPKPNTTYNFLKNETIENALLLHYKNVTVENATVEYPPKVFPTDPNKYKIVQNGTILSHLINATSIIIPPKVFPTDTTKYKFMSNKTIEETFLSKNANHTQVDTEVPDLMSKKHYQGEYDVDQINPDLTTTSKTVIINSVVNNTRLLAVQSEDNKILENGSMVDKHFEHDHLTNGKSQVAHGPLAGILIGVLLLVALVGYASLVLWRRSLEIKYGTRERLVNEEDFDPHYDNRFEL